MRTLFLILLLSFPGSLFAGKGYLLSFTVKAKDKKKLPGITIRCFNDKHVLLHEGTTDKKGEFNWTGIEVPYLWVEFSDPTAVQKAYTYIIENKTLDQISEVIFLAPRSATELAAFQKVTGFLVQNDSIVEKAKDCSDGEFTEAYFKGSDIDIRRFLENEMKHYSKIGLMSGTVELNFAIEKDGSIRELTISKGVTAEIDEEAIRIVALMPNWIPAKCNGENVKSYYSLPIKFNVR